MDTEKYNAIMAAVAQAPENELPISMGVMMGLFCSGELSSAQRCFLAAILVRVEDTYEVKSTLLDAMDQLVEDLTEEEVKIVADLLESAEAAKNGGLN